MIKDHNSQLRSLDTKYGINEIILTELKETLRIILIIRKQFEDEDKECYEINLIIDRLDRLCEKIIELKKKIFGIEQENNLILHERQKIATLNETIKDLND